MAELARHVKHSFCRVWIWKLEKIQIIFKVINYKDLALYLSMKRGVSVIKLLLFFAGGWP